MSKLYRSLVHLQTFLMSVLLLIVSIQVLTRLLPFLPHFLWTEEIARFLLIWVIFLGASIGIRGFKYAKIMVWDISDIAQISMIWVGAAIPAFGFLSLLFIMEMFVDQFNKEGN